MEVSRYFKNKEDELEFMFKMQKLVDFPNDNNFEKEELDFSPVLKVINDFGQE